MSVALLCVNQISCHTYLSPSRLHYDSATSESGSFSAALKELVLQVWSEGVSTLYTPRAHLEMAGLMRQATENTTGTLMQVQWYQLWCHIVV